MTSTATDDLVQRLMELPGEIASIILIGIIILVAVTLAISLVDAIGRFLEK